MMLFGATLLVLLIAGANLANLVLLRGEARRAEFALRAALGAGRARLARQVGIEALVVFGEAMRLVGLGVTLGLAGAVATGHLLRSMLFGIAPMDPITLAGAVVILILTSIAACHFPIRRATRMDAVALLREG